MDKWGGKGLIRELASKVISRGLLTRICTDGGICIYIYIGVRFGDGDYGALTHTHWPYPTLVPRGSILTFRLAHPGTSHIMPLVWMSPYLALLLKSTPKAGISGFFELKAGTLLVTLLVTQASL